MLFFLKILTLTYAAGVVPAAFEMTATYIAGGVPSAFETTTSICINAS